MEALKVTLMRLALVTGMTREDMSLTPEESLPWARMGWPPQPVVWQIWTC